MTNDPLLGRVLGGRYRIERKLGQGGMGAVYAAVHLELARPVAVKTLLDVVDPRDVDRLRTEALAAASLAHPHIVSVTDFAAPKGDEPAFLVMELLAGHSLAHVLARDGALSSETAIHVTLQILDALAAAHAARILHRDIKPANVIVLDGADMTRPWIKVVDFGIAKIMDDGSRHTTTGTLLGTPAYMAPEQLLAERATERTDIYSVGVCLFEMLAGSRPFTKRGGELVAEALKGEAPALPVEPRLAEIVKRAMHRDSLQRFASARDFAAALRAPAEASVPPKKAKPWALFVGTMLVTVAAAALVFFALSNRTPPPSIAVDATMEVAATPDSEVPVVAVDAEAEAPVVTSEEAAPPSRSTRGVFSVCVDSGDRILCPKLLWNCECQSTLGSDVYDSPDESQGQHAYVVADGKTRNGSECRGWTHGSTRQNVFVATPTVGHFRCYTDCDSNMRISGRKVAIPGTRCVGFLDGETPIEGTWKPTPR